MIFIGERINAGFKDIKNAISKGLNLGNEQRKALVEKGHLQANKFSWQQTAKNTIEVYQSLL